jgi:hypothetical protein
LEWSGTKGTPVRLAPSFYCGTPEGREWVVGVGCVFDLGLRVLGRCVRTLKFGFGCWIWDPTGLGVRVVVGLGNWKWVPWRMVGGSWRRSGF